jgi:hypothetical protein
VRNRLFLQKVALSGKGKPELLLPVSLPFRELPCSGSERGGIVFGRRAGAGLASPCYYLYFINYKALRFQARTRRSMKDTTAQTGAAEHFWAKRLAGRSTQHRSPP